MWVRVTCRATAAKVVVVVPARVVVVVEVGAAMEKVLHWLRAPVVPPEAFQILLA